MNKGGINPTLGRYIKERRLSLSLDVRTAAEQAGIDHTYWWKLEAGRYRSPDPRYLKAIAEAIDVPLVDLYGLCGYQFEEELPSLTPYLRTKYSDLPPEAVRDLEHYFDMLRKYYDIPPGQPVFPARPKTEPTKKAAKPSLKAKNRADHPWRGAA